MADSVRNLWKKIKNGTKQPRPADRLAIARHRRGKRGHETSDTDKIDWDKLAEKRLGQS